MGGYANRESVWANGKAPARMARMAAGMEQEKTDFEGKEGKVEAPDQARKGPEGLWEYAGWPAWCEVSNLETFGQSCPRPCQQIPGVSLKETCGHRNLFNLDLLKCYMELEQFQSEIAQAFA